VQLDTVLSIICVTVHSQVRQCITRKKTEIGTEENPEIWWHNFVH